MSLIMNSMSSLSVFSSFLCVIGACRSCCSTFILFSTISDVPKFYNLENSESDLINKINKKSFHCRKPTSVSEHKRSMQTLLWCIWRANTLITSNLACCNISALKHTNLKLRNERSLSSTNFTVRLLCIHYYIHTILWYLTRYHQKKEFDQYWNLIAA